MQNRIKQKLKEVEQHHLVHILYACESGSRAWGFPSPNSDYDVRFIYVHPFNKYLSIDEPLSHLSLPIDDELDLHGWDLKKSLQLIRKSNTTPFEWLQSPIIYQQNAPIARSLWQLCPDFFNGRGNIFHYLGIAKSALQSLDGEQIGIKKLFYVLRPLLCAKWCLEKQQIAPMTIAPLLTLIPSDLKNKIEQLITYKATVVESSPIVIDSAILSFIEQTINEITNRVHSVPERRFKTGKLDDMFMQTLMGLNT
jgi:uncharacterized protein